MISHKAKQNSLKMEIIISILLISMLFVGCSDTNTLPWDDGNDGGSGGVAVATPTFSVTAGAYTTMQTVAISCGTADTTIYYSTNGSTPPAGSTEYATAINVSSSMTLRAIAVKTGLDNSVVASAPYSIGEFLGTESGSTITLTNYAGTNAVVTIPNLIDGKSVVAIGQSALANSTTIASVTIPDSVTNIALSAISLCNLLTNVIVGNGVISIGDGAFAGNGVLSTVILGNSLITIGESAFNMCTQLISINIPDGVTFIGADAFNSTSIPSITLPASITSIGVDAFRWIGALTNVIVLATTPPAIGADAFDTNGPNRKIYVPAASLASYQTSGGWSVYGTAVVAIP